MWAHAFDADGGADTILRISTTFGTPASPISPGRDTRALIYDDPTNDYDISDAVLLTDSGLFPSSQENTDTFVDIDLTDTPVTGVFWVAILIDYDPGQFPAPMDLSCGSNGRAWIVGNTPGGGGFAAFDYNTLTNNDIPPAEMGSIGFAAQWLLRAEGGSLGTKYCVANNNSTGSPADIAASGSASSAAGDLTLTSAPVPNQNGIFFHGDNQVSIPFGNGFMCTSTGVVRGNVVLASGNSASYTYDNSGPKRSLSAFISTTRNFQHWTRDPMGGGAQHNTSNAISIDILP
jgi:hypothetical protein